jgi:ribosome-associated protein
MYEGMCRRRTPISTTLLKKPGLKKPGRPAKDSAKAATVKSGATRSKKSEPSESAVARMERLITATLSDNKAEDIVRIDLSGKSSFADEMIVASGRSSRHVAAMAEHVAEALRLAGYASPNIEGKQLADWVLIDAGDIVVHLFRPEVRQFYNLEKMWSAPALPVG